MSNIHPVDAFGEQKALLADMEIAVAALRLRVIALGEGAHEGELFRSTVKTADRDTINWKAVAYALKPSLEGPRKNWSEQLLALVTSCTTTAPVTRVTCDARIGKAA